MLAPFAIAGVGWSASENSRELFYEAIRANDLKSVRTLLESGEVNAARQAGGNAADVCRGDRQPLKR